MLSSLQEIFESVMGPEIRVEATTSRENLPSWDSVNHLNLILELEERFALSLTPAEIEDLSSVQDIVLLLQNRAKSTF